MRKLPITSRPRKRLGVKAQIVKQAKQKPQKLVTARKPKQEAKDAKQQKEINLPDESMAYLENLSEQTEQAPKKGL